MIFGTALFTFVLCQAAAQAQWGVQDLNPFNRDSGINRAASQVDQRRLDVIEGSRYKVTIRNPTEHPILFSVNGMPQMLTKHQRITLTGRGNAEITFDYGLGNGSYRSYGLRDGRTYFFRWNSTSLAAPYGGRTSLLD